MTRHLLHFNFPLLAVHWLCKRNKGFGLVVAAALISCVLNAESGRYADELISYTYPNRNNSITPSRYPNQQPVTLNRNPKQRGQMSAGPNVRAAD